MRKLHKINTDLARTALAAFTELFEGEDWFDPEKHHGFSIALLPVDGKVDIVSVGEFSIDGRKKLTQEIAEEKANRAMTHFCRHQTLSSFHGRDPSAMKYGGGLHYASQHNEGFLNSFALAVSGLTEAMDETVSLVLTQLHLPESKILTYYQNFIKRDSVFREGLITDAQVLRDTNFLIERVSIPQIA